MSENGIMPAESGDVYWRDPDQEPPPRGVKMLLLTTGGVAILGGWSDGSNLVAWSPLPVKRLGHRPKPGAPFASRWSIERVGDELRICMGNHEKHEPCLFENWRRA